MLLNVGDWLYLAAKLGYIYVFLAQSYDFFFVLSGTKPYNSIIR